MHKFKKNSIAQKWILSFCLLISLFFSYGVFTFYDLRSISSLTRTIYDHPLVVSNAALMSNISITKMHRNMKDIVLIQSPEKTQPVIDAVAEENALVLQHLDIVRDRILGQEGKILEKEARQLFEDWRPIRAEVIQLVKTGQKAKAADMTMHKGAAHVMQLENKMLELTSYARNKASSFINASEEKQARSKGATIIFLTAGILLSSLIAAYTLRQTSKAEKELQESKQLHTNAIDHAPIGMVLVEPGGRFFQVNNSFCKMTGYSERELLKMVFQDITHPDDQDIGPRTINRLISGEADKDHLEKRYIKKDGGIIDAYLTTTLLKDDDGAPQYFFTQIQDITERKKNVRELKRLRDAIENSLNGFDIVNHEARFVYVNKAYTKMWGYESAGEIIGTSPEGHCVDPEMPLRIIRKLQAHGEYIVEFPAKRKDGSTFDVLMYARLAHDEAGNEIYPTTSIDISDRKKAEKEKKRLENQLRHSQQLESIGNLAGGIAHDFNNILSSIIGFTELALDDAKKGSHLEDYLQEVYTAGKRAKGLVKQILAFARQSEEESKPIQVNGIVREVLKFIRSSIPATISIDQDIESESLIMGNAIQIHQIMMNLCTNAAQAMEDKGGTLRVSLADIHVGKNDELCRIGLMPGNYINIEVSDTGPGIAPHLAGSIFEPYFTTKNPGEGSGMGLAVVHGIVEHCGGKITVDSRLDEGTTFMVYLPVTRKRESTLPYETEPLPSGNERVLFIDDEPPIAKMGSQILERLGYTVTTKTSSIEALELFRSNADKFDLVISDMTMPNMTGDRLATELMKVRPDIPVILCTGFSKNLSDDSISRIGIKAVAYKPIVMSDLAKHVRTVLDDAKGTAAV